MNGASVVMFPGLGANYPRMVAKYLHAHPEDAATLDRWSALIDAPLFAEPGEDPRQRERLGQLQIHALNLLWWRRLGARFTDVAVCGHSLGYYAALVAAGVLDEESSLRLVDRVFDIGWRHFGASQDAIFVVTTNTEVDFAAITAQVPVEVLSENNPLQRVMCGSRSQYRQVVERLNGALLGAVDLGTRVPFHSPRMQAACGEIRAAVDALEVRSTTLAHPLWSHISARPLAGAREALDLVVEQPHRPVRWLALVDALIQAGRYDFVEVGPNRVLTQIVRWISPKLDVRFVDNLRR